MSILMLDALPHRRLGLHPQQGAPSCVGVTVTALLLLLASTLGLAAHDHLGDVERGAVECAVDHDRAHAPSEAGPVVEAGERHQHHCVGCRHSGHRGLTVAPPTAASVDRDVEPAATAATAPRARRPTLGGTLRGPPTA